MKRISIEKIFTLQLRLSFLFKFLNPFHIADRTFSRNPPNGTADCFVRNYDVTLSPGRPWWSYHEYYGAYFHGKQQPNWTQFKVRIQLSKELGKNAPAFPGKPRVKFIASPEKFTLAARVKNLALGTPAITEILGVCFHVDSRRSRSTPGQSFVS